MKILQLSLSLILVSEVMKFDRLLVAANKQGLLGSQRTDSQSVKYIIGGHNATKGQIPYQAVLMVDDIKMCGGSLIAPNWVLSAAHCTDKFTKVVLGGLDLTVPEEGRVEVMAKRIILHNSFNKSIPQNDIMLVELEPAVEITSTVNIVTLVSESSKDFAGVTARVSGYGVTSDQSDVSMFLKYADVRVINNTECKNAYENLVEIRDCHICTTDLTDIIETQCTGDSGGPLVDLDTGIQIGIVSFGPRDGCENKKPKGLTRVSYFIDWIRNNTGLDL